MPLAHEDVAVRRDVHRIRLKEEARLARATVGAEAHEQFARGRELEHLMTEETVGRRGSRYPCRHGARGLRPVVATIHHPHVALTIHVNAVRPVHHAAAERAHQCAVAIEQQHGIEVRPDAAILPASFGHPHTLAIPVDRHRAGAAPGATGGELRPSFDGAIRIRSIVHRSGRCLRTQRGRSAQQQRSDRHRARIESKHRHHSHSRRGWPGGVGSYSFAGYFNASAMAGSPAVPVTRFAMYSPSTIENLKPSA